MSKTDKPIAYIQRTRDYYLALGYGARAVILKRQAAMRVIASKARPVLGIVFVAVGIAILMRVPEMAEGWLVQNLPAWLIDLSVAL